MSQLPLLGDNHSDPWLIKGDHGLTQFEFLDRVHGLADRLPGHRHAIVLTKKFEYFLAAFCAVMVRGQTAILASQATEYAVSEISRIYPDSYTLVDSASSWPHESVSVDFPEPESGRSYSVPTISADRQVAVLQTSGSTGEPVLHGKTWGTMVAGAERWRRRFELGSSDFIVATVPARHMYGFETSVLLPLYSGTAIYAGQPVFPADVAAALSCGPGNATLVTTPTQLKVFARSEVDWPQIRRVISSTSALDAATAKRCEQRMNCGVTEIFGSTETGAIGSRRCGAGNHWTCLDGLEVQSSPTGVQLRETGSRARTPLDDALEIVDERTFRFLGRKQDVLKIAGKRASLSDLSHRLNRISGVQDGVLLRRTDPVVGVDRLVAVVVAPDVSKRQIRNSLASQVDSVFLPRLIFHVDKIPRSAAGKMSQTEAQELLEGLIGASGR